LRIQIFNQKTQKSLDFGTESYFAKIDIFALLTRNLDLKNSLFIYNPHSAGRHKNPFNFSIDIVFFKTFEI